jgi:hypothetical protein
MAREVRFGRRWCRPRDALALLVALPPLVLWLVWLAGTPRTNNAESSAAEEARQEELYARDSRTDFIESSLSRRRVREES